MTDINAAVVQYVGVASSIRSQFRQCMTAPTARSDALSRRAFLGMLTAAPLAAVERPLLIDTHLHVWSGDTKAFPFAHPTNANFKAPPLAGTAEMLLEEMERHAIDHAVLVQVIYYGWDNRYIARCIQRHPRRFRAQGLIDPTDPEVAAKLEYWMREHGLSGVRLSPIYYAGRDDWLTSEPHHRLWKKAAALGAIFNFFIAAHQLAKLETMLAAYPEVRVVIDHLARVDLAGPDAAGEVAKLTRLARFPNVWVKVSELNLLSPSKTYPYADTFPWVKRVYETFGPDRLLWGTGFPGTTREQAGRPPLEQELALVRRELPFFSTGDRDKLLGGNAAQLWKFTP
jgi:predicted TIM-barrel fold metal-dependent hydrolase